jgi:hypothetical protein
MSLHNPDEWGMTPDDHRYLAWELDRFQLQQSWKALKAMWAPPVVDQSATQRRKDGYVVKSRARGDEWTWWRGVQATVGVLLGRYWTDRAEEKYRSTHGFVCGLDVAYWDAGPIYGGHTAQCLWLYPGCRVEFIDETETNL